MRPVLIMRLSEFLSNFVLDTYTTVASATRLDAVFVVEHV